MPDLPANSSIHRISSSSGLVPESSAASSTTVRSRNRRPPSSNPTSLLSTPSESPSRGASPLPSTRIGSVTGRNNARSSSLATVGAGEGSLFGGGVSSWAAPSWSSIQGLASSFLGGTIGDGTVDNRRAKSRLSNRNSSASRRTASGAGNGSASATWGPEPPSTKPRLDDVATGSLTDREAKLKAMKTASVLQSHEGVNGGLDVAGRFKKRRSDEDLRGTSSALTEETEEHLVYIHHVQPSDTYAGIVLKYRCREDAFRKANGLWSRDNTSIQVRKWLALPVDACEIRGRPCEAPSYYNPNHVDLLAPTPDAAAQDDPFNTGKAPGHLPPHTFDEDSPWTHVRWVTIENFTAPIEIARVPRKALGYFPPRRKKSLLTGSSLSTPRGSMDVPSITLGSETIDHAQTPGSTTSRRMSILSGSGGARSVGDLDNPRRPAWMRRPGGVGSLHSRVRGPERDYFNTWTKKHLGLNADNQPSMSIMGSETARIGFDDPFIGDAPTPAGIVESPFEDGRDTQGASRGGGPSGMGLDKAAATVETWLRGAFAKIPPGTPVLGPRSRSHTGSGKQGQDLRQMEGDLIELTDNHSDDDARPGAGVLGDLLDSSLLSSSVFGSSGRSDGGKAGGMRGEVVSSGKGKKAD